MNRKLMRLAALLIAILLTAAVFAACKKEPEQQSEPAGDTAASIGEPDAELSGRYLLESVGGLPAFDYFVGILPEDATFAGELPDSFNDPEGEAHDFRELMTLTLNEDGTGCIENVLTGEKIEFSWGADGNKLTLATEEGSAMNAITGDGKIILTIKNDAGEDEDYVFSK